LRELGLEVSLLSGDRPQEAERVARELGIPHARGGLLPQDKLNHLRRLQEQGEVVVMVGDGVNDAPVLAGAQASLAMGGGTQLAQASADMILLSENLSHIPAGVRVARRTMAIIRQNLAWALGYNLIAVPAAAAGFVPPWLAAIGMSLSSIIVVLNALRLRR
jgi:Cu2+-exporting ATPase